jgi:hypothetical protein
VSNLPQAIHRFITATNDADSDAFVATFASHAYLEDWGRAYHGHEGARAWNASDNVGKQSHFDLVSARQQGEEWVVTLDVSGNGYNGRSDIRFIVAGDLLSRMVIAP